MTPPDAWDAIEKAEAESRARKERWEAQGNRIFFKEGDEVTVRFLTEAPHIYYTHDVPPSGSNQYEAEICLDPKEEGVPCPGCEAAMKRKLRGAWLVIQRQRPQLRKGADGKAMKDQKGDWIVDSYKDEVAILDLPQTGAARVRKKNVRYNGIQSRDWIVGRTGGNFDPYEIEPANPDAGPSEMTEEDKALIPSAAKIDLDKTFQPPSYSEFARKIGLAAGINAGAPSASSQSGGSESSEPTNVFLQD